ncbi:protein LBH [Brachyhypopomus gauderio]|uniref:protein LBH n=1 Tax=Brachyhypopomus gauderio TaxID=698409 RepID=UPI004041BA2D
MDSSQQDCSIKKLHLQSREECMPYQIFPDSSEDSEMSPMHQRRRLPSIVVDPTQAEEDRGQLPWPPHRRTSGQEQEDDSLSQANILSQGENVDADREQRGAHTKHSTANASPGLIDHTLLTPPPSPEPSEVAPPCFRG